MLRSLVISLLLSSALAQSSNDSSSACPTGNGIHIIVARASLEPPGFGIIGSVKDNIISRVPGSNAEAVGYPATLNDYQNSETAGVVAMRALISQYLANCQAPLVLMGYSQGAQVSLDSFIGQMDQGFTDNSTVDQALSASDLSRIAAVVVMGDPTFNTQETFNAGNATQNGDFPRQDVDRFTPELSSKIVSYCDQGDLFCAGGNSIPIHLAYVSKYGQQAADFVVNKVGGSNSTGSVASSGVASASKKVSSRIASATASASRKPASASASASRPASGSASASASASASGSPTASGGLVQSSGAASSLKLDVAGLGAMLGLALFL